MFLNLAILIRWYAVSHVSGKGDSDQSNSWTISVCLEGKVSSMKSFKSVKQCKIPLLRLKKWQRLLFLDENSNILDTFRIIFFCKIEYNTIVLTTTQDFNMNTFVFYKIQSQILKYNRKGWDSNDVEHSRTQKKVVLTFF